MAAVIYRKCGKLWQASDTKSWQTSGSGRLVTQNRGKLVAVAIQWQTCGKDQFVPRDSGKLVALGGSHCSLFLIRYKMEDPNWIQL